MYASIVYSNFKDYCTVIKNKGVDFLNLYGSDVLIDSVSSGK